MSLRPSTLLRPLLARLLRHDEEEALGDLEEGLERRLRGRGQVPAELWYVREAVALAAAVVRARSFGTVGATAGLMGDVRPALRALGREPGTTTVIVVTLAVAAGAATAMFAVADAAFLRPLPYPDADRLVRVYSGSRNNPSARFSLSPLDIRDLASFDDAVEAVGAWADGETVHWTDGAETEKLDAPRASAGLFRILGIDPVVGRFFSPDDETPGADDVVVLSHGLWVRSFGADPAAVGRLMVLDGRTYRVIGVAPPRADLAGPADLWRPLALGPEWYEPGRWGWQFLSAVARLAPGLAPGDASQALTRRLAASVPGRAENGQTRVALSLYEERLGASGPALLFLIGAVGLLLAMACANVMNVVLARAERRVSEFALRRALGSGARPLFRLVALETLALAAIGGVAGTVLAYLVIQVGRGTDVGGLAYLDGATVDHRVAAFAVSLVLVTAGLFGAAPLRQALRADPHTVLKSGLRGGSSRAGRRMRDGLVVVQVAVAGALLVAVGLSATAFRGVLVRDPGFQVEGVLTADIELPPGAYGDEAGVQFYRDLFERLRALPGVEYAGAVGALPLTGRGWSGSITLIDPDPGVTEADPGGNMRPVSPDYFDVLGIPVLEGRAFTDGDDRGATRVAIVDEVLARRYWPGGSPIGRQAYVGALMSRENATIVGVVGAVPDESLTAPPNGHVYFPLLQRPMPEMTLVVRTDGDPAAAAGALRSAIRSADPRIPVEAISTLEARVRTTLATPRAGLLLLSSFSFVALLLAAVGIYGVLSYAVTRRSGEIGMRMALGAAPGSVVRSVVADAMRLWSVGAVLGGMLALVGAQLLTRSVPGIRTADPVPYVVAFAGLGLVGLLAALWPAVRATGVDPARTLRADGP